MLGRPRNVEGLRTPRIGAVSKSENGVRTILGRLAGWGAGQTSARRTKEAWTGKGEHTEAGEDQSAASAAVLSRIDEGGRGRGDDELEGATAWGGGGWEDERRIFNGGGRIWRK
jgi:hypothetical protein